MKQTDSEYYHWPFLDEVGVEVDVEHRVDQPEAASLNNEDRCHVGGVVNARHQRVGYDEEEGAEQPQSLQREVLQQ